MSTVPFRRDNGEIIQVDGFQAMHADMGFLTLPDGEVVRRHHEGVKFSSEGQRSDRAAPPETVSYAMGVGAGQLEEVRAEAKIHRLPVEYKEDPAAPGFYNAHFRTTGDMEKAARFYGLRNKAKGTSSHTVTRAEFERARARTLAQYPVNKEFLDAELAKREKQDVRTNATLQEAGN